MQQCCVLFAFSSQRQRRLKNPNNLPYRLLGKWPNTYAYTKAVAEHVIREEAGDLPVGMFRPAIGKFAYGKEKHFFFLIVVR